MEALSTILGEIEQVVKKIDESKVEELAGALLDAPRVFVTGEGRSGFMAKAFAMRLMHLGLTVYAVGETISPSVKEGDALVAVSGSGTTEGTVRVAGDAQKVGAKVYAITTNPQSDLGGLAKSCLVIPAATKWRRPGEVPTQQPLGSLFDQCTHIALDAVCLRIAERKGMSNEEARKQHANTE